MELVNKQNMDTKNTRQSIKYYKCDICDKVFSQHESLKTHMESMSHKIMLSTLKCDLCDLSLIHI